MVSICKDSDYESKQKVNARTAQDEDDEKLLTEIIEIQDDEEMNEDQIDTTVEEICDSQASEIKRDVIL